MIGRLVERFPSIDVPSLFVFQWISLIVGRGHPHPVVQGILVKTAIERGLPNESSLPLLVSLRFFEPAYHLLMTVKPSEACIRLFLHSFFAPTLLRVGSVLLLEKCVRQQDLSFHRTDLLWSTTVDFASEHGLLCTLFHLHMLRNSFEDAPLVALELFDEEAVCVCQLAHLLDAQALYYRAHLEESLSPSFRPRELQTTEGLERLVELTQFVSNAVEFCLERRLSFLREYNLLKRPGGAQPLGALFLIYRCA